MGFATAQFIGFLAAVAALYAFVPRKYRCLLIVVASYSFYWLWSQWFALLLFGTTVCAFYAARAKSTALTACTLLLALLVLFKSLPLIGVSGLIPLGVSYYIFKLGGYLLDVYWGVIEPEQRLLPFVAYTAFFPQIVAGPIQRAQNLLPQLELAPRAAPPAIAYGILRITLGFFKKYMIADHIGHIVDYTYAHLTDDPGAPVLLGFYGYPLQMYADFSGLSDIAIGAAMLLGIRSPENFNAPFFAASPSEYWRRWHITLTKWMTDYVFTPLRMSTRQWGNAGLVLSLFANMIAIGLWHGFYWTFALFGVVHALYLCVDALTHKARARYYKTHPGMNRLTDWMGPVITFHLIAIAFVFFRAGTLQNVGALFAHIFAGWGAYAPPFRALVERREGSLGYLGILLLIMAAADALRRRYWLEQFPVFQARWGRWSMVTCSLLAGLIMVGLLVTQVDETSPFLYAIF